MKSIFKKSLYLIMVFCLLFLCVGLTTSVSAADTIVATFEFGENSSEQKHVDGTVASTYTEESNGYTLKLTVSSSVYSDAYDAKGNSCLKLGTSSKTGSFSFDVPLDVTSVVIKVAGYKAKTGTIKINDASKTLTKQSNNGEYDEFTVDTTSSKTINFAANSAGRCMINTIVFYSSGSTTEYVTAKFDSQGGTSVSTKSVEKGTAIEKPTDPTRAGYEFVGWFTEADETFDFSTPITTDITLYAKWKEISWYNYSLLETNASLNISYSTKSSVSSVKYFEKVTEALEDYSGTYLIVYEAGKKAFNGLDAANGNISVNIEEDNTILELDEVNTCKVLIKKLESGEGYSIRLIGKENTNRYIGKTANNNGMDFSDTALVNTISVANGVATIKGEGGCEIKYNAASGQNRFRYYKSGQQPVALYKLLEDNEKTSTTESFTFANASLRFGIIKLPVSEYEKLIAEKAEFGIAIAKGETVDLDSAKKVACTPVRVNANGEEDANGEFYQFAVVIDDITEADYDKEVTGVAYVKIGEEYHTVQEHKTFSVKTIAKYYVDLYNSTSDENVKATLEQHINALKALAY